MFQSFVLVLKQRQDIHLSFCFLLFLLCGRQVLFFFPSLTITGSGRLAEIRWSVWISIIIIIITICSYLTSRLLNQK